MVSSVYAINACKTGMEKSDHASKADLHLRASERDFRSYAVIYEFSGSFGLIILENAFSNAPPVSSAPICRAACLNRSAWSLSGFFFGFGFGFGFSFSDFAIWPLTD
jgi:hypothetical protein